MKKLLIIILLILLIVIIGLIFYLYPSLRPALGPPVENVSELLPNANQPEANIVAAPITEDEDLKYTQKGPFNILGDFKIEIFAENLNKPRVLKFDDQGNLLVSAMGEGKVYAIKPDGSKVVLASNLKNPHGLEIKEDLELSYTYLYIAETYGVVRYPYNSTDLELGDKEKLFDLPDTGGHYTRTIKFGPDGNLYVSVGSSCNVCNETDERRASILKYNPNNWSYEVFAKGLRNTVFFIFDQAGKIWGGDMGRDLLGDNTPPEEINIVKEGGDYGWPICYGNKIHDSNFDKNVYLRDPCFDTQAPIYELPAHFAPLGLTFIDSKIFPAKYQGDILLAMHGSWNRTTPGGYKIVLLDVEGNSIVSDQDFMTGFLSDKGVIGRPVDLVFGFDGSLYLSDDKAGVIYKISK